MADPTYTPVSTPQAIGLLVRQAVRAQLQYRTDLLTAMLGGIAFQGAQLLFIGVVLNRFGSLAGWSFAEIAFLFAVRLAAHACYVVPFGTLFTTDMIIRNGEFDRYLLRPVDPYVQLVTQRFRPMAFGDALLGAGALIIFAIGAPVHWNMATIGFLLVAVLCGGLVETGIQTVLSGLAFRMTSTTSLRIASDELMTQFSGFPLTMFGHGFYLLTFGLPMAFVAYLPTAALLGRTGEVPLPGWLVWGSPAVGVVAFVVGYLFFRRMSRSYISPSG